MGPAFCLHIRLRFGKALTKAAPQFLVASNKFFSNKENKHERYHYCRQLEDE
jgi:hypothetical protein